ncbi:MAG: SPOR domain-containing protein [Candidatus Omnitrophica bacterium]|nr:SPOR domain-containing protein [Candidatus Omnitrophota bacterium]
MDEEKYQKELFEFEKPKRFFPRLSNLFPKADFERNVILTLTLDRAVFIAIGIIMAMVVVYAMGVEKGKQLPVEAVQQAVGAIMVPAKSAPTVPSATMPAKLAPVPAVKALPAARILQAVKAQPAARIPAPVKTTPYTIVAVTLARKDTALREAEKLKGQGYNVYIVRSGAYFQVCVGAYADKTTAQSQKDLTNIRRLYKDAYLKSRG